MQKFLGTKTRSKGVVEVTGNERILPGKGPRATRPKAEDVRRRNTTHDKAMGERETSEGNGEEAVGNPRG